ncbi:hypothetical protein BDP27DRAFT_1321198 [Rhodocollybia butyracea]|uniref:Uncharacterized protein n=1 Tax=Rhodocollybia butyracea TaxID=206335 RepID=A0A9P5PTA9_9AGAR|nr:hypothetical protein BDP27DRAFT_1321198 [Rhodocollybia butyracea]
MSFVPPSRPFLLPSTVQTFIPSNSICRSHPSLPNSNAHPSPTLSPKFASHPSPRSYNNTLLIRLKPVSLHKLFLLPLSRSRRASRALPRDQSSTKYICIRLQWTFAKEKKK